MEGGDSSSLSIVEAALNEGLEALRRSLFGELQKLREKMAVMEKKVDCLVLDRLAGDHVDVGYWT